MKKLLTLLGLAGLLASSRAQVTPITLQYALSNTWALTNVIYQTCTNANPISLQQGRGFSVSVSGFISGTAWTTGQVALGWTFSVDGTNYATDTNQLVWHFFQPNGALNVRSYTNFPAYLVDNARWAKILLVTNNNNATSQIAWLTNVIVGIKQ